jgi:hypothetical protein
VKYARGQGPPPPDLELIDYIDRFGVQGVLGRMLYRREAMRGCYLMQIYKAVRLFDKTADIGQLMQASPDTVRMAQGALHIAYG